MYDCQEDRYTDFSFVDFDSVGRPRPLSGSLVALALPSQAPSTLQALADFAAAQGYQLEHAPQQLLIHDVSFTDALAINQRFGDDLIISCDLRRSPPAHFG